MTNWTDPPGVPLPGATGVTVAVKVTLSPKVDGFELETRFVVVFALFTVWPTAAEVDPLKFESPA
jgi:hypothetical protein